MTEEESLADPKNLAGPDRHGEALLYDFSKSLISLAILVLGAMLTLSQSARQGDIKLFNIILVLSALALAAILAFSVAHSVVNARANGLEPPRSLPRLLKIATGALGLGIGGFLMLWIDTLS